jgi:hypothetical protein
MSRGFQHFVPTGLTTAILFYLAESQTDQVIAILFPASVSTFDVAAYHVVAFAMAAVFTVAVPLSAARFVDWLAGRCKLWAWAVPIVVPAVLWACVWVGVRADSFIVLVSYGLLFWVSVVCAGYCGLLLLERLVVYGFELCSHRRTAFCCSECAGRVSVTVRSPRRRIAERFR